MYPEDSGIRVGGTKADFIFGPTRNSGPAPVADTLGGVPGGGLWTRLSDSDSGGVLHAAGHQPRNPTPAGLDERPWTVYKCASICRSGNGVSMTNGTLEAACHFAGATGVGAVGTPGV